MCQADSTGTLLSLLSVISSPLWLFFWPPVQPSWAGDHNTCWSLWLSAFPGSILADRSVALPSQSPAVFKEQNTVKVHKSTLQTQRKVTKKMQQHLVGVAPAREND